jgi:hypothetical protein
MTSHSRLHTHIRPARMPHTATRAPMVRHAMRIGAPRIATRLYRMIRSLQAIRTALRPHAAVAPRGRLGLRCAQWRHLIFSCLRKLKLR